MSSALILTTVVSRALLPNPAPPPPLISEDFAVGITFVPQAVEGELWWEVSVELPKDAVNMVFVVNFEGAWDNNGQKDHRVQVALPSGFKDIAEWAESFYEEYYKEEKKLRLEKEEAARKKEELRLKKREEAVVSGFRV